MNHSPKNHFALSFPAFDVIKQHLTIWMIFLILFVEKAL